MIFWFNDCCNIKPQIKLALITVYFSLSHCCIIFPLRSITLLKNILIFPLLHSMPIAVSYFFLACFHYWPCKWTGPNFSICNFRFPWNNIVRATLCFLTINLLYSCLNLILPILGSSFFVVMTNLPDMLQDIQVLPGSLIVIPGLWGVMPC